MIQIDWLCRYWPCDTNMGPTCLLSPSKKENMWFRNHPKPFLLRWNLPICPDASSHGQVLGLVMSGDLLSRPALPPSLSRNPCNYPIDPGPAKMFWWAWRSTMSHVFHPLSLVFSIKASIYLHPWTTCQIDTSQSIEFSGKWPSKTTMPNNAKQKYNEYIIYEYNIYTIHQNQSKSTLHQP